MKFNFNTTEMKHLQKKERSFQTSKEIIGLLQKANRMIHSSEYREEGYHLLSDIEKQKLTPEEQVQCHYLNARYFYLSFVDDQDLENLEYSHDFLNDLVQFAFDNNIHISNYRIHFMRAKVKLLLAQNVWEEERVEWLIIKAKKIMSKILLKDPKNEEYLTLQSQIAA